MTTKPNPLAVLNDCPSCKGSGEHPCEQTDNNLLGVETCNVCSGTGERQRTDLFEVARDVARLEQLEGADFDALAVDIDFAILSAAYEMLDYRDALARLVEETK